MKNNGLEHFYKIIRGTYDEVENQLNWIEKESDGIDIESVEDHYESDSNYLMLILKITKVHYRDNSYFKP